MAGAIRGAVGLLLLALFLVSPVHAEQHPLPLPPDRILTIVEFAARWQPVEGAAWSVCRHSHVPPQARLGAINTILGRPDIFRLADGDTCAVTLVEQLARLADEHLVRFPSCTLALAGDERGVIAVRLATDRGTSVELQKCLFRLGLWIDRRAEWIILSDEDLFLPLSRSRWRGLGPTMPDVVPIDEATQALR